MFLLPLPATLFTRRPEQVAMKIATPHISATVFGLRPPDKLMINLCARLHLFQNMRYRSLSCTLVRKEEARPHGWGEGEGCIAEVPIILGTAHERFIHCRNKACKSREQLAPSCETYSARSLSGALWKTERSPETQKQVADTMDGVRLLYHALGAENVVLQDMYLSANSL